MDLAEGQLAGGRNGFARNRSAGIAGMVNGPDFALAQGARIKRNFINQAVERFLVESASDVADADGRILCRVQIAQRPERGVGLHGQFSVDKEFQASLCAERRGDVLPLIELNRRFDARGSILGVCDLEAHKARRSQVYLPWIQTRAVIAAKENDAAGLPRVNPAFDG